MIKLTGPNQNQIFIYLRGVEVRGSIHWIICHVQSLSENNKRNSTSFELFVVTRKTEINLTRANDSNFIYRPVTQDFEILTFVQ